MTRTGGLNSFLYALDVPIWMRKLKIPNKLRLDFPVVSWYFSDQSGLDQSRK